MKNQKTSETGTRSRESILVETLHQLNRHLEPGAILESAARAILQVQNCQQVRLSTLDGVVVEFPLPVGEFSDGIELPLRFGELDLGRIQLSCPEASLSKEETSFIHSLAEMTAIALENARRLAEVRQREQKLERLLEILPVGVSILNAERKLVFENPTLEHILEINSEGLKSGAYKKRIYLSADGSPMPPDRFASVQAANSGQAVYNVETGVVKENGETTWASVSAVPVNFPDWKTVIVTTDITERKRSEEKLSESEQKYTLLFQKSAVPTVLLKLPEVVIMDTNEASEKLTGFTRQEMFGKTSVQLGLFRPDVRKELISHFERQGELAGKEVRLFNKNGEERLVITNTTPVKIGGEMYALTTMQDITERRQAEEALRQSEQQYRTLFEKASDGILIVDAAGNYADANQAGLQMLGYAREELIGLNVVDVVIPGEAQTLDPEKEYALEQSQDAIPASRQWHFKRKDGSTFIGEVSGGLMPDGKVLGILRDITERTRAEEALRQRTEELEQLLDILPQAIWIANDPECKIIRGNRFANELLGVSGDENISQSVEKPAVVLRQFSQGRELSPDELPMQMAARTGKPQLDFELRIEQPGRASRTLLGGAVPLFDPQAKTRGVISLFHDITDRKRTEENLRASEKLLKDVIDNTAALVYILDLDGRFLLANNKIETLFGLSNEQIVGQTREAFISAEFAQQHRNNDLEIIQTGQGKLFEEENLEPDGRHVYLTNKVPLFDAQNQVYAICGISTDMTGHKHMEEDLRRSNAELEQFAYVASHDLQEPLRTVAGMVELLKERYQGKLDERADTYITHAVDGSHRMQKLINDLLEYSRVNRFGKLFKPNPMETVLATALTNLQAAIEESQAQITHDPLPVMNIDPLQMTQVLQNLIGNAIKFRSERPLEIHLGAQKVEGAWQFSLRDNGIGIDPRHFERIFIVFQRLHTRRNYPGTGIGLALCKKIIERHGGKIWLESSPKQGTTFFFTIPEKPL